MSIKNDIMYYNTYVGYTEDYAESMVRFILAESEEKREDTFVYVLTSFSSAEDHTFRVVSDIDFRRIRSYSSYEIDRRKYVKNRALTILGKYYWDDVSLAMYWHCLYEILFNSGISVTDISDSLDGILTGHITLDDLKCSDDSTKNGGCE